MATVVKPTASMRRTCSFHASTGRVVVGRLAMNRNGRPHAIPLNHMDRFMGMSETTVQPVAARFVGQSIARKEDPRLVTGHGQYVDDVAVPGLLHGAFLRSEVAKGTITSIDTAGAAALPGVVVVYTWSDFDGHFGE